jgi:exopolysaccharide biosynthesis polyprenyl glycosylphosphotransferase
LREDRDWALRRLFAGGDTVAILLALLIALTLPQRPRLVHQLLWGLAAVPLMLVVFKLYGLYDRDARRIGHSAIDDLPWLFHAAVIGGLILWLYSNATPMHDLNLAEVLLFDVSLIGLVTAGRSALRVLHEGLVGRERALLVGGGAAADALVSKLALRPEYRLDVIGSLRPARSGPAQTADVLGAVDQLDEVARRHGVTRVVFVAADLEEREIEDLLRRCRALSLKVSLLPRLSEVLGSSVEIEDVEGVTLLGLSPPWLPRSSRATKRALDLLLATVLLILFAPLALLLGIAIKLDSRGPVMFAQERVGKGGRRFRLLKLRTMVDGAEGMIESLSAQSRDPNWLKLDRDPRVTRVGRALRRFSLDEMPQLWNVVRGDMSLVGPRPLVPGEDERVLGWARGRLDLTPGITGYWQVHGRTEIPFEEMVKLDYLYVVNWSLWQDVRLLLRTLPVVIRGRGAN